MSVLCFKNYVRFACAVHIRNIYIYIYICVCVCVCVSIYIYIYIYIKYTVLIILILITKLFKIKVALSETSYAGLFPNPPQNYALKCITILQCC